MTRDEAREILINGMNHAAYHETDYALFDSDKNCLFGSEHYNSGRSVARPSPWPEGDFEEKMATLLLWANLLSRGEAKLIEAQKLIENEDPILGRVIRRTKVPGWKPLQYSS